MAKFGAIRHQAGFNLGAGLVAALRAIGANFGLLEPSVRTSAAADYVPIVGDSVIRRTNAGAQTLTVPTNATQAHPIGTEIVVIQDSAGALTIAAAGGVTLTKLASKTLVAAAQNARVVLSKIGTNNWLVSGDLTAV